MTFDLRLAVIALATFAVATGAGSIVAVWLGRRIATRRPPPAAATWFALRLLPVATAAAATCQGVASFVLFEPRQEHETFGLVLIGAAIVAAGLLAAALVRLVIAIASTRRALTRWMASAEPVTLPNAPLPAFAIDSPFPVVAVVGILRPRLIVARQVIAHCGSEELAAIAAHEARHVRNHDNIRRAILLSLPDPLSFFRAGGRLNARWHDAIEDAADDAAAESGPLGRAHLASALVRVARLAPSGGAVRLPASALYRGENIDRRVRRLLAADPPAVHTPLSAWRRAAVATVLIVTGAIALHGMHELVEIAASLLP